MDLGHQLTDEELAKLERRIAKVYKTAADEMQDKITEYFKKFDEQDKKKRELLEQGKITEQEYKQWRLGKLATGKKYQSMRDQLAERMTNANQEAVAYVNSFTPTVYSLNRNYTAYQIEQADITASFQLWDESTVARLIKDNPELMPNYPKEKALARGIDLDWGKKQISKEITTGILLGESNQRIAKRLLTELPNMNKASAIRTARTATTSAENGGRLDTFKQAEQMGIPIKKQWRATHDGRTREEHILADGQIVGVDEPFIVGGEELMKPGDDSGSGWNIYNCRCGMYSIVKGRVLYNPDTDANYQKWLEAKQQGGARWEYVEKAPTQTTPQIQFTPAKTRQEAEQYALKFANNVDYKGISADNCNEVNKALTHLFSTYKVDKYETILPKAYNNAIASANYSRLGVNGKRLGKDLESGMDVFRQSQKNAQETIDLIKQRFEGKKMPWAQEHTIEELEKILKFNRYGVCDTYEDKIAATITHEFGHTLSDQYIGMINHGTANPHYDTNWALRSRCETWSKTFNKAIENGDIYKISQYASKNYREFFAECFVMYDRGEKLPEYIYDLMKGTIENGML